MYLIVKKILFNCLVLLIFAQLKVQGQCANDNTLLMSYSPACTGSPETITSCIQGGQYVAVSVVAGTVYTFTTCGNTAYDTQITIYNSSGGGSLGYNDDNCGLQSTVTWTATFTGTLWVLVDKYFCTNNTVCIPLLVTCNTPPPPSSSCLSPLPDICTQACDLGTLPTPPACVSGGTISNGTAVTFNLSNVGAIAENPYSAVVGCATPGTDVWYRFKATGTQLVLNIASLANALNNPNVSLYNGNNCNALLPLACFTGSGGTLSQTYAPITPNDFYYLQISGGNVADVGDFTLTIRNNYDCDNCLLAEDLQVTPPPVNGTYGAGQTVQFCFTVSNYNQTAANWLHGIDLNFGAGWNLATLTATSLPPSCSTTTGAYWGFYNSVTGNYAGTTYGPGFWYETTSGSSSGVIDANPGNNFGDVGVGTACPRTFCWQITTQPPGACTPGANLSVSINTLGDSESGSWGSLGCTNDPIVNFLAALACCAQPVITTSNTNCGLNDGKIVASGNGSAPWDYVWANSSGTVIATHNNVNGADSIINLASGNYFLTVTDNLGCSVGTSITVNANTVGSTVANNTGPYCIGQTVTLSSSNVGTGYNWSGPGGYTSTQQSPTRVNATSAMSGTYTVTVTFGVGCTATAQTNVMVNATPTVAPAATPVAICNGQSTTLSANATPGSGSISTYTWSSSLGNVASGLVSPITNSIYTVTVTNSNACTATGTVSVTVNAKPTVAPSLNPIAICNGQSTVLAANATAGSGTISTYAWSTGLVGNVSGGIVSPTSNTTYTVTVVNSNTCTATGTISVTVNALPIPTATNTGPYCTNSTIHLNGGGGNSYSWSGPNSFSNTTQNPAITNSTSVMSGTYTVTVTNAANCTATASTTVIIIPVMTLSTTVSNVSCNGGSNGAINLAVSSGQSPYTFSWSNVTTSQNLIGVTSGTYSVTVIDNALCTTTISGTISQPPLLTISETHTNVLCNGAGTGSITVTTNGGTAPLSFNWNDGVITQNRTNLTAGNYSLTVTDNNLCSASISIVITEPVAQSLSEVHADVTCGGATPGAINVTNSGGVSPYTYLWNDGATTQDRINISAGNYSLTVTDNNACTASISILISTGSALTLTETHSDVLCFGGNNASINISAAGATPGYSFAWNDGIMTQNRVNLVAGTYIVTASDATTCSTSISITISDPPAFGVTQTHTDVTCNGGSIGTITISPSGGVSPYTYAWNDGNNTQNRSFLSAGNYSVTVSDYNACTFSISMQITEPALLNVGETHTNILCHGANTGSINLNVGGGTSPYNYQWNDANTSQNRTGISAGNYAVTVTDNNSCSVSFSIVVSEPANLTVNETHVNVLCNGGNTGGINISPSGGVSPYNYVWNDGIATQNRINLVAGNYSFTITDNNSCSISSTVGITEPTSLIVNETHLDVFCNGNSTGSINLNVNGATSPYTFIWNDAVVTQNRNNISTGNYSVTVTDNNLCSSSLSVNIAEPTILTVTETHVDVACSGGNTGSIDVTVTGATFPYTYLWNDGVATQDRANITTGNYSVTVSDNHACISSLLVTVNSASGLAISESHTNVSCNLFSDASINLTVNGGSAPYTYLWNDGVITQNRSNIPAGNYSVSATDNNSCVISLNVSVTEPSLLGISETHANVLCNGGSSGSINITPTGATSPYTFVWNDATTTEDRNNISIGNYSVTVNDNNACSSSLTVNITEPAAINLAESHVDVLCNGGSTASIDLTASGGTSPYTYVWNDALTTEDRTNVSTGNYSVTVNDNNSCSASLSTTINQPSAVQIAETHQNVSCHNGNDGWITLAVSGGTPSYSYLWNSGSVLANPLNMTAGNYTVTVSDNNYCSAVMSISLTEPTAVSVSEMHTNITCNGYSDGAITISVSGGTPLYSYVWNDGITTQNRINVVAGNYSVTVNDNNLCSTSSNIMITEPTGMLITSSFVNPTCPTNNNDGSITLNITGGSVPYQYHWSTGSATNNLLNAGPGNYLVTVSDANTCSVSAAFTLVYQYDFTVNAMPDVSINFGESTTLDYTVTGNAGIYTNVWSPSSSLSCNDCASPVASPVVTTLYQIEIRNDVGCVAYDNVTVIVVPDYTIFVPNAFTPNGDGNNDVFEIYGKLNAIAFLEIQIFNRWGEKVFESNDHHFQWDGSYKGVVQNSSVYIWQIKLTFLDGHKEELRKGSLTLTR